MQVEDGADVDQDAVRPFALSVLDQVVRFPDLLIGLAFELEHLDQAITVFTDEEAAQLQSITKH
jgi:hypothetical protein